MPWIKLTNIVISCAWWYGFVEYNVRSESQWTNSKTMKGFGVLSDSSMVLAPSMVPSTLDSNPPSPPSSLPSQKTKRRDLFGEIWFLYIKVTQFKSDNTLYGWLQIYLKYDPSFPFLSLYHIGRWVLGMRMTKVKGLVFTGYIENFTTQI